MLRFGEPLQAAVQGDGAVRGAALAEDGGQVERDVPERVDRRGHILARLKGRRWIYRLTGRLALRFADFD